MERLINLAVGTEVMYIDKGFDDGFVREYTGKVAAHYTEMRMTAVHWIRIRHWNPLTQVHKFDSAGHLMKMDSLNAVEIL